MTQVSDAAPGVHNPGIIDLDVTNDSLTISRQPDPAPAAATVPAGPSGQADRLLQRYRRHLLIGDAIACTVAVTWAVWLRFDELVQPAYQLAPILAAALWLGLLGAARTYETRFLASGSQETERVVRAGLALFTTVAVASYSFNGQVSRSIVLFSVPTTVLGSLVLRRLLRQRVHRQRAAGFGVHRTVIVGRRDAAHQLIVMLKEASYRGLSPVAACVPATAGLTVNYLDDVPVFGHPDDVLAAVDATGADTVAIVSNPDLAGHELRRLSWALEERRVDLLVSPGIIEVAGPRLSIRPVAGLSLLHLEKPSAHGGKMLLKAAFDRTLGILLLLLFCPALLAIALAVRFTDRGPVFFRQVRVGVDGKEFAMFKFRSMVEDAEQRLLDLTHADEGNGVLFKLKQDPRVTRVGAALRRYSLDELPQLINVARGEMSLVGPRPPLPAEVATYDSDAVRRLRVRPGMTGLWQVSGRSDLTWEESLRLDLRYVDNWTIGMDLTILWRTFRAVVQGSGAY